MLKQSNLLKNTFDAPTIHRCLSVADCGHQSWSKTSTHSSTLLENEMVDGVFCWAGLPAASKSLARCRAVRLHHLRE